MLYINYSTILCNKAYFQRVMFATQSISPEYIVDTPKCLKCRRKFKLFYAEALSNEYTMKICAAYSTHCSLEPHACNVCTLRFPYI